MAPGLDGVIFALTTLLISIPLIAFPTQTALDTCTIRTEDLGFYPKSTTRLSFYDLAIDVLHPRGVPAKKTRHFQTHNVLRTYISTTTYESSFLRLILLSGDISLNPGPVKHPCGKCSKPVRKNQHAIVCDNCTYWFHLKCI